MAATVSTLRSTFDPASRTIALELDLTEPVAAGGRLAFTSIVQLTPTPPSDGQLVRRIASYHELAASSALAAGDTWTVACAELSHMPNHANDGPVSAFLIHPDETTSPVTVEAMRRVGDGASDAGPPARDRSHNVPPTEWNVVPHPAEFTVVDAVRRARVAHLAGGPDEARVAWAAVAALDARAGGSRLVAGRGAVVRATTDDSLPADGYRLTVDDGAIAVAAAGASGFRHAFVTLVQLLAGGLPTGATISDRPRYAFRGLHIDLARQWFPPQVVDQLIDIAAWRKLSHLHLHLTDDEAWRLPVAALPELASIGGTRGHGLAMPPMLGGAAAAVGRAYTAEEIGRWVARADELGIVLVPEVDLPAHVHAALTALPRLRDPEDESGAVSVQYYVDNVLVPGHPETIPFVEEVVDAVAWLFPSSPYIHIGGDEVAPDVWRGSPIVDRFKRQRGLTTAVEVEAAFHRELVRTIRDRTGRSVGAWQEAAQAGGVQPTDGYVVGWRTVEVCRELAASGFDVVVSPAQAYYLDMATDTDWSTPGASWAGSTSLQRVCQFDPADGWSDAERAHLLGVQACLWTETVHDEHGLARLLFPRLDAIAERGWTGRIEGGWQSLARRAAGIGGPRLTVAG